MPCLYVFRYACLLLLAAMYRQGPVSTCTGEARCLTVSHVDAHGAYQMSWFLSGQDLFDRLLQAWDTEPGLKLSQTSSYTVHAVHQLHQILDT